MDIQIFIKSLAGSMSIIEVMLSETSEEQARWKPEAEKWSVLEIVNHLYDEEREDFRQRLDLTLHQPGQEWPGIDPEGWVTLRRYNQKNFLESLSQFKSERIKSLQWLENLSVPRLEQSYLHPVIGKITAGDLLAAWAAHDYLHIRQLANLRVQYLSHKAAPFSIRYAGA